MIDVDDAGATTPDVAPDLGTLPQRETPGFANRVPVMPALLPVAALRAEAERLVAPERSCAQTDEPVVMFEGREEISQYFQSFEDPRGHIKSRFTAAQKLLRGRPSTPGPRARS